MRIGLLGTGSWARRTHAPGIAAHPGSELVGVWGRRPAAAAELAAEYGVPAYEDVDALIAACDAVSIALPPQVQAELAERAARAGRHLLLDKPLALTVADAERVVAAADAAQVASVVFFTTRFARTTAEWTREQAARGGWFTAHAEWLGSVFADPAHPLLDSPWRAEHGALWDVGPHALSLLLPVLGPAEVRAAERGPGDTAHLVLRHASGASSTLTLSLTTPEPGAGATVRLHGAHGTAVLPDRDEPAETAFTAALDALAEAAATGVPDPRDARFALDVVRLLAAAESLLR